MEKLEEVVDQCINKFIEQLSDKLDDKEMAGVVANVKELEEKKKNGTLDLNDLKSLMLLYKSVIIPASMVNEVSKLRAISGMINGSVGIRKPS